MRNRGFITPRVVEAMTDQFLERTDKFLINFVRESILESAPQLLSSSVSLTMLARFLGRGGSWLDRCFENNLR